MFFILSGAPCGLARQSVKLRRFSRSDFAMTEEPTVTAPSLPRGEIDPNQLYIAVGKAVHAWEGMEEALARLFALVTGLPENPEALADYGSENRRFVDRLAALVTATDAYFVRFPHQDREAEVFQILDTARNLSIKRHRIAHGHITMWGEFKLPENLQRGQEFSMSSVFLYRWGAPFYSMVNLRADPVGGDAASIDAARAEFENLHNRIAALISVLPKPPLRDTHAEQSASAPPADTGSRRLLVTKAVLQELPLPPRSSGE
jgi:hypothetical protein